MEKENGDSGGDGKNGGAPQGAPQGTSDQNALLDAASLFGAYWPRDGSASSLFPGGFHTGLGAFGLPPARNAQFPSAPHPHPSTMAVAASQAASLGMHPAASAAWWSMASHLAAQDYLSRLQASGIGFTPPDLQYPLLTAPPAPKSSSKSSKSSKNQKEKSSASPNLVPTSSTSSSYQKQAITTAYNSHKNYSSSMSAAVNSLSSSSASSRSERTVCSPSTLSVTNKGKMTPKASTPVKEDPLPASHTKIQSSPRPRDPVPPPATMSLLSAALEGGDPSAILGVRLPPDTEIIKYTSSIVGPKIPGTTNRGRKKTISLDPPSVSLTATMSSTGIPLHKMKRARMDSDYSNLQNAHQNDRVEVIKLPPSLSTPNGGPPNPPLIHKHMISLLTKPLSDPDHRNLLSETSNESGLNLTVTSGLGDKDDAPLNLSLKPQSEVNSSLNSLSNITAAVGNSSGNSSGDRVSRRKPGAKPRRVIQEPLAPPSGVSVMSTMSPIASITPEPTRAMASLSESPRPSSGSEENDIHSVAAHSKEGRPRNLGRGVSKPKKNTVASLLAQSRALGIKPMLATQYLADDLEKLRQALGESAGTLDASTDSEGPADGDGESEGEDPSPQLLEMLRFPLERGWKRETIIRGLTRNGGIRGEVTYYAPASTTKLKHMSQVTPLLDHTGFTRDHFSFSSRPIVGWFLQPAPPHLATDGEFIRMSEETVLRRLEELKALARHGMPTLNVDHRIELARQQQALRDAKKQAREDLARSKEMARNAREQERTERLETQRKERELRNQQVIEARKKRQDELDKQRLEEQQRKQQERELKRQQSVMLKEQVFE